MTNHDFYMQQAIDLASQALGQTSPNPMVGAVIVKDDQIIGKGFHRQAGSPHGEIEAINSVEDKNLLPSATLYVTLEPCNHHGRTPPCSDAVIASGIKKVIVGSTDANPKTNGSGISKLRDAGIEVTENILNEECKKLNKRYFVNHLKNRPYIILKWAETKDGFLARPDGSSKWISSESARKEVHRMRSIEDGILVGSNTALIDNPELTVRHIEGKNPTRILLDSQLKVPRDFNIFNPQAKSIIINQIKSEIDGHLTFLKCDSKNLPDLLQQILELEICSVIIEGGANVLESFISQNLWDEAFVFVGDVEFGEGVASPLISQTTHAERRQNFGATTLQTLINH